MSVSLASVQAAACRSGIGKETNRISLLQAIAQSLASALGLTVAQLISRACTSGIGKVTDENALLRIIAQSLIPCSSSPVVSGLSNGLVSYWKLDETDAGTGVPRVDSVGLNTMTFPTAFNLVSQAAKINLGMRGSFGANVGGTRCTIASPMTISGSFSVSFWMSSSYTDNANHYVFGLLDNSGNGALLWLQDPANPITYTTAHLTINGDITDLQFQAGNGFSGFYHYVITVDSSAVKVYRNGAVVATTPVINAAGRSTPVTAGLLGKHYSTNNIGDIDAVLDEVGFWTRALTAAEVSALYNGGSGLSYQYF